MSKKSRFRGHLDKQHGQRTQTLFEISITVPLSYFFVTGKEITFEKVPLIEMANLGTAC